MARYDMDPEVQTERDRRESEWVPYETKCHSISFGCRNRWFRLELNPVVTIVSALCIWALVAWCMIEPEKVGLHCYLRTHTIGVSWNFCKYISRKERSIRFQGFNNLSIYVVRKFHFISIHQIFLVNGLTIHISHKCFVKQSNFFVLFVFFFFKKTLIS